MVSYGLECLVTVLGSAIKEEHLLLTPIQLECGGLWAAGVFPLVPVGVGIGYLSMYIEGLVKARALGGPGKCLRSCLWFIWRSSRFFFFFFVVGIEPKTLCIPGKRFTSELRLLLSLGVSALGIWGWAAAPCCCWSGLSYLQSPLPRSSWNSWWSHRNEFLQLHSQVLPKSLNETKACFLRFY